VCLIWSWFARLGLSLLCELGFVLGLLVPVGPSPGFVGVSASPCIHYISPDPSDNLGVKDGAVCVALAGFVDMMSPCYRYPSVVELLPS